MPSDSIYPAPPADLTFDSGDDTADDQALAAAAGQRVMRVHVAETGTPAMPADVIVRNGTDPTGEILAYIRLAPGESWSEEFGDDGVSCADGLYIDRNSGLNPGQTQVNGQYRAS